MWCIGNEVPDQWAGDKGPKLSLWLQNICHREDPTRPVTQGMDAPDAVVNNNMAAVMDVPGFNYRPFKYIENYKKLPQEIILRNGIDHQFAGSLQIPGSTTVHAQIPRPPVLLLRCGTLRVVQSSRR